MSAARPAINVVEKNPYLPQPFVFDAVSGSGNNGSYHTYGFAQFHITGFTFPSGGSAGPGGVLFHRPSEHNPSRQSRRGCLSSEGWPRPGA